MTDRDWLINTVKELNCLSESVALLSRLKNLRSSVDAVQVQRLGMRTFSKVLSASHAIEANLIVATGLV